MKKLYQFQKEGVNLLEFFNGRALLADDMGLGKAQPYTSKILTPIGYIKLGECEVGTPIFGADGNIYKVSGIYPQGIQQTYKITFSDSSYAICTKEHLWNVITPSSKNKGYGYKTVELGDLMQKPLKSGENYNYSIPMTKPLNFRGKSCLIHPYVIGILLGDGGLSKGSAEYTNSSQQIKRLVEGYLPEGFCLSEKTGNVFNIINENGCAPNAFRKYLLLEKLNVLSIHKHIPKRYLFNSVKNRIALLNGLCDTDGYAGKSNEYSTSSRQLAFDFQFLVESLGGRATIKSRYIYYMYKGEKRKSQKAYRIIFKLPIDIIPYRLSRKRKDFLSKRRINPTRSVVSIEKYKMQNCMCISTTAPDSLYLTNHAIVTHNTVQVLVYLYRNPRAFPTLIVCPSGLKINWKREIHKWLGGDTRVQVLKGQTPYPLRDCHITIINYDILKDWADVLQTMPFRCAILDEAHAIKSAHAKRTAAVLTITKKVRRRIAVTGTPIENRPIELFNLLNWIRPDLFPDVWRYAAKYCNMHRGAFGMDLSGASNLNQLNRLLKQHLMIRRRKQDVLTELPPKIIINIPVQITNRTQYKEAEDDFINYVSREFDKEIEDKLKEELKEFMKKYNISSYEFGTHVLNVSEIQLAKQEKIESIKRAPILTQIEALKQIAVQGKMVAVFEWIDNFLTGTGEKLVIFAEHRFVIETIHQRYPKVSVKYYGNTTEKQKIVAKDSFIKDKKCRLFVASGAAGEGLTLTVASNVLVLQYPWNPMKLEQRYDRVHRITQNKQVTIYNIIGVHTIEEDIVTLLNKKRVLIKQVIDGEKQIDPGDSLLNNLVKIYKNKK